MLVADEYIRIQEKLINVCTPHVISVLTGNHVTHDSINKHVMLQLQSLYATSPPTSFLWG